ncbi:hypothetical protein, partial [Proteiniphilum sp. UBA5375]|uniref:hypothetical protein n=1 Tax=Proteiniphilum sp. UBA5375 TaxID=1947278 RepID=UPI0025800C94
LRNDPSESCRWKGCRGGLVSILLWLLLTSHGKLCSMLPKKRPHVRETSRGKINNLMVGDYEPPQWTCTTK